MQLFELSVAHFRAKLSSLLRWRHGTVANTYMYCTNSPGNTYPSHERALCLHACENPCYRRCCSIQHNSAESSESSQLVRLWRQLVRLWCQLARLWCHLARLWCQLARLMSVGGTVVSAAPTVLITLCHSIHHIRLVGARTWRPSVDHSSTA